MKSIRSTLLAAGCGLCVTTMPLAGAEDLWDIYAVAVQSDPSVQAAEAAYHAAREAKPQAIALLLPQAQFSMAAFDTNQERRTGEALFSGKENFDTQQVKVELVQPVFRFDNFILFRQADTTITGAEAQYAAAQQDLVIRVAERYFGVLAAEDNVEFARAEKNAIARQLEQAKKRFDVGLIAITDVHEAQARYDLAVAQEITALNELDSSREALREITGTEPQQLAKLTEQMELIRPDPEDIDAWAKAALDQNLLLLASESGTEVQRQEVWRKRAQHLPTLDIEGVVQRDRNGGGVFGSLDTDTDSIGLRLRVPLFEGGAVFSRTREAEQRFLESSENTEKLRRSTLRLARDAYRGVIAGIARVQALKQALVSNQSALEATEAGFEVGTRTIVDVLNAQRELYRARRDYAQARYNYLLNSLRLKQAAGTLSPQDLEQVNQWLAEGGTAQAR